MGELKHGEFHFHVCFSFA